MEISEWLESGSAIATSSNLFSSSIFFTSVLIDLIKTA